jgi:hypothetical protein
VKDEEEEEEDDDNANFPHFSCCGRGSTTIIAISFPTVFYQQHYNIYHYAISFNFSVLPLCFRAAPHSKSLLHIQRRWHYITTNYVSS